MHTRRDAAEQTTTSSCTSTTAWGGGGNAAATRPGCSRACSAHAHACCTDQHRVLRVLTTNRKTNHGSQPRPNLAAQLHDYVEFTAQSGWLAKKPQPRSSAITARGAPAHHVLASPMAGRMRGEHAHLAPKSHPHTHAGCACIQNAHIATCYAQNTPQVSIHHAQQPRQAAHHTQATNVQQHGVMEAPPSCRAAATHWHRFTSPCWHGSTC